MTWSAVLLTMTLAGGLAGSASLPQGAEAAEPASQEPPDVTETVTVSATRSDRLVQDEPLRVEVIDREEIEEKALMTPGSVGMLLGETTGLRVQTVAPSIGAANVRIQGLRGHYAQMLADGLPLYGGGGDSLSLLQVPPLDLGRVEIIKGAASALYGPAALGGVVNLISRRPVGREQQALVNVTSLGGTDVTYWHASAPSRGWSRTLIAGVHRQAQRDVDDDGWADVPDYLRLAVRPRVFYDNGRGATLTATGGAIVEDRNGGTVEGRTAPDGHPFHDGIDTRRGDIGGIARWLVAGRVLSVRGSFAAVAQARSIGGIRERGARRVSFAEASMTGSRGRHTYVIGGAVQRDVYAPDDVARFRYAFTAPAVFAQDEIAFSPRLAAAVSVRVDAHSQYGTFASPRVSVLYRPSAAWTARVSAGTGWFAPTPFTEETDEIGLTPVERLSGIAAERARTSSADLTWRHGAVDVTGTLFGSVVRNPVQLVDRSDATASAGGGPAARFENAPEPTRTWGGELLARYRLGELTVMVTHAYTRSSEYDIERGQRLDVPLNPRQASSLNLMWEGDDWGRAGVELYYIGRQRLEDNPFRSRGRPHTLVGALYERRFGAARVFVNAENLGNVRQTRFEPLVLPARARDGRWTVDAWAPLDGVVANGGIRVLF